MRKDKNIIMHFKGQEEFVSRMLDLDDQAYRRGKILFTPFLNENEQDIVSRLPLSCQTFAEGGYEGAELKRVAFSIDENRIVSFPIVGLIACYDTKFHTITHRDVLGAFMKLGIERNVLGDIIVQEGKVYLFLEEEIADFVKWNLTMIKRCSVSFETGNERFEKKRDLSYEEMIIASFRLDVVVSAITHLSRDKAKMLIRAGHIKVNQVVLEDYDYLCNNNSTISIRRYGRYTIENLNRNTKKGRHVIRVGKYI